MQEKQKGMFLSEYTVFLLKDWGILQFVFFLDKLAVVVYHDYYIGLEGLG